MESNRKPAGDERRWKRRLVDMPIRIVADELTGTGVILARGTTMSPGGACLFALANLAIGAQIDVEFTDSDCSAPTRVSGIVRNRSVYLYGVEFLIEPQEIGRL
jgi:hypothetical protein